MSMYAPSSVAVTEIVFPGRPAPSWPSPELSFALHFVTLPSKDAARGSPLWPVPPGSTALAGLAIHGSAAASTNAAPASRTAAVRVDRFMADPNPARDWGRSHHWLPAGAPPSRWRVTERRLRICASPSPLDVA